MSRGLGREQLAILRAMETNMGKLWWSRMELQQKVWGAQAPTGNLKRYPQYSRPYRNVRWSRKDGSGEYHANHDSTFGRALVSLAKRGLLERSRPESGYGSRWRVTGAGWEYLGIDPSAL